MLDCINILNDEQQSKNWLILLTSMSQLLSFEFWKSVSESTQQKLFTLSLTVLQIEQDNVLQIGATILGSVFIFDKLTGQKWSGVIGKLANQVNNGTTHYKKSSIMAINQITE